jgi:exodeoxyribonuclease V gamma subunit
VTLHLHRADGTDVLAGALARVLAEPLADPFAQEVVVVPAKGVERWLAQRLSHSLGAGTSGQDGVCAGVRFLSPRSLVALLTGTERTDPWDPDRLVWPLLEVIDESLDEDWCATLARHLGRGETGVEAELREGRRYSVARRLAGLFAGYAVQRPALITAWREGRDEDGVGHPLDEDLVWQPELWRRVIARVGAPPPDERHQATLAKLEAGGDDLDLPGRLSLFGHTRLPATEIALLRALGEHRDVHLWLPQVSAPLAEDLVEVVRGGPVPRTSDLSAELVQHPLLASLGRDSRELQRSLAGAGVLDAVPSSGPERATLLGWLQHDLRANALPAAALREQRVPLVSDRSVQVHACHGPARQVEVLREVLVGLLEDDDTLEPRDILVMCPDVETFAPLIEAGFGLGDVAEGSHPAHRLRVRLADRGLQSTNALLSVAGHLVALVGGRARASEVLDLLAGDVVRRRFGFDDKDLAQVTRWVADSGVRWGLDAPHRASFGLEGVAQNTWRSGLDRILLGVAMDEHHDLLGGTLPLDDVGSGAIDLVGRLAEALDRIEAVVGSLEQARTATDWVSTLRDGVHAITSLDRDDAWQAVQFDRELAGIEAAADGGEVGLRLADVRSLLDHRLAGRPTRANFRTGTLTVCTMVPMRSVPHRVVCLLGLDDGVFPRSLTADGDDVLARDPVTGERDPRSEDRQLLLDALLAATETLVITYSGASEHTGQERPPAVPVGEVLDALDRTAAGPVRARVQVVHPLQPFDARNLIPGELGTAEPFSFDTAAKQGALAARHPQPLPAFLPAPVPAEEGPGDVSLSDLESFFRNPARALLRRLEVATEYDADEIRDAIPIDLDSLEKWSVGDRVITAMLAGADSQRFVDGELNRGSLPPGELAHQALRTIIEDAGKAFTASARLRTGEPETVDVVLDLGDGRRLVGAVSGLYGDALVRITYSSLRAKPALALWLDLLVLQAGTDTSLTGYAFGKGSGRQRGEAQVGPVSREFALDHLRRLVAIRDRGLTELAPLPLATGRAWAVGLGQSVRKAEWMAGDQWVAKDTSPVPGDNEDPAFVRLLGQKAPLSTLVGLGSLAQQVWTPLLAHERGW